MNSTTKYLFYSLAAVSLVVGAFLVFAALTGTPLRNLRPAGARWQFDPSARPVDELVARQSSILGSFLLPSPFTSSELAELELRLQDSLRRAEAHESELAEREARLDAFEEHLDERLGAIAAIELDLEHARATLEQRVAQLRRDADAHAAREDAHWELVTAVFAQGEPKELAPRLVQLEPTEAARVLRALPDLRAAELLNSVPVELHLDYAEAYRRRDR